VELCYRFAFDAAHRFTHFPAGHPNASVHGHSFEAEIALEGERDPRTGFVVDFARLEAAGAALREQLDHKMLNDIPGLAAPSLENLCIWIWQSLEPAFPSLARVTVRRESAGQSCTYRGPPKR
jgi:6-pyruvoyltetrahydropterin/6-carboxytetrahydropterin synthase